MILRSNVQKKFFLTYKGIREREQAEMAKKRRRNRNYQKILMD